MFRTRYSLLLVLISSLLILSLSACNQPQPTPSQISVGCSVPDLIQAIKDANANPDPTEINLGYCQYTLTEPENSDTIHGITMQNGLPVITSEITIRGNNAVIEIVKDAGEPDFGHFFIAANGDLKLYDLLILNGVRPRGGSIVNKGGKLFVYDVTFKNNSALPENTGGVAHGGAIYSDAGEVRIMADSHFQENQAGNNGTINDSHGGAVYSRNGSLLLLNSSFLWNQAAGRGGAIYTEKSASFEGGDKIVFENVDFRESIARQDGGAAAFINELEEVLIVTSLFSQGEADGLGAGIYAEGTSLVLNYSRLNANTAAHGGAVYLKRVQQGDRSQLQSEESEFHNNTVSGIGGAIFSENADLDLKNPQIHNNQAASCGGIRIGGDPNLDIEAGDLGSTAQIPSTSIIDAGSISGNTATDSHGGGICHLMGNLTINGAMILNNQSPAFGGGVLIMDDAELIGVSISGNQAGNGGGLMIGFPVFDHSSSTGSINYLDFQVEIENSILMINRSDAHGGGIYAHHNGTVLINKSGFVSNSAINYGGGIYQREGDLTLHNSTLSGNQAARGGGLYSTGDGPRNPNLEVIHTTVAYNTATEALATNRFGGGGLNLTGNVLIEKSLVTQNIPVDCAESQGGTASLDHNVDSDGSCYFWQTVPNPQLGPGNANYHPVLPGSPLIDLLPTCGLPDDQQGTSRPKGSGCEPGSFEYISNETSILVIDLEDLCEIEVVSLTMLSINPETLILPLYVRFPDTVPGLDVNDTLPYQAFLGSTEAHECNTQGFEDRLYCMFTLQSSVPGTVQSFQLFQDGCQDPVYTQPKLTIPEVAQTGDKDQPSLTCRTDLDKDDCLAAGGVWPDSRNPSCDCP